jgi:hypothetical protein
MRKKIIQQAAEKETPAAQKWLDLQHLAQVELTSEDAAYPIERAIASEAGSGWKATEPGEQSIRFIFDEPQKIGRIQIRFRETDLERTQEFLLRWLPAGTGSYQEILRQQYNFSPPHATEEYEDYTVDLNAVQAIELVIIPEISGGSARASLAQLQVGP